MPYTWDNKWYPPDTDNRADFIGFCEIGGIGQLIYHTFTFNDYEYEESNGAWYMKPILSRGEKPSIASKYSRSGEDIFIELYNLGHKINDISDKTSYIKYITDFCCKVAHPYFIDELYTVIKEDCSLTTENASQFERDAMFSVSDFLHDLERFYTTAHFYFALKDLMDGTGDEAYQLYREGKMFDELPFFEEYKHDVSSETLETNVNVRPDKIVREMQEDIKKQPLPSKEGNDWFVREPIDYYDQLVEKLIGIIPDFQMCLKRNPRNDKVMFAANVNSVFDIAWYTLAHMIADYDPPTKNLDEPGNPKGTVITCLNCGIAFVRRSNRQLYCAAKECQNAHNAKRQRQFRERKRRIAHQNID